MGFFDIWWLITPEPLEIGIILLSLTNRKPYVICQMVPLHLTLSEAQGEAQGQGWIWQDFASCRSHERSRLFVTCEIFDFRKYSGRLVCLFVFLFVCFYALYRSHFWVNCFDFSWVDRYTSETFSYWNWWNSVQGQGQGHRKCENQPSAISQEPNEIQTSGWHRRVALLMRKCQVRTRPAKGQWPWSSPRSW